MFDKSENALFETEILEGRQRMSERFTRIFNTTKSIWVCVGLGPGTLNMMRNRNAEETKPFERQENSCGNP